MIIVTGGAGLIGSAVIWQLNRQGRDDIVVVDHLRDGEKWRNLAPLCFRDYFEKETFFGLLEQKRFPLEAGPLEAVIHLGACSSTTERDASYLIRNNFEWSKLLCRFALEHGARFVYASSAATYGDGTLGFFDNDTALLPKLRPLNAYGYSKQIFDLWLLRQGLLNKVTGLKYFNVFGPNEHHKQDMRSVVLKAFGQIRETGGMTLFRSHHPDYADGEQLRDFVYVKDAAAATVFFMEHPQATGIFNIGGGVARSWNDMAHALFAALKLPERITYIDMPESLRPRYQYYTCAATEKLHAAGFTAPFTKLEDAVADYVRNYLLPGKYLGDE
ncbi:MAG: ADP-glyceromanno-heptose 6-epimerase [Deltaproteobacteria bacterium]|nr:ADP-glyceromanno-heptose 6-epimerase [Deltaproteobacteria bacterium]